jgi:hypothetical protein
MIDKSEIDSFVESIQSEFVKKSAISMSDAQNMPSEQLLFMMKKSCNDKFTELYNTMERFGKERIQSFSIITNKNLVDDVWHNFVTKKLSVAIIRFDRNKLAKFTTIHYKYITNFCIDVSRNLSTILGNKRIYENHDYGKSPDPGEKINRMEVLNAFIDLLDTLRAAKDSKLVFHCKRIIGECYNYGEYTLLKMYCGKKTLKEVTDNIEKWYSNHYETKTEFMKTISEQIKTEGISENVFLENVDVDMREGRQIISNRIHAIKDAFENHKDEFKSIIDNIR